MRAYLTLVLVLCVPSCGPSARSSVDIVVDTLETGRVVVQNSPSRSSSSPVRFAEDLRIGSLDGDDATTFGNVGALAVGHNGVIFVGDYVRGDIRAFAQNGAFVRTIAVAGSGPGEIPRSIYPFGLLWQEPNRLWVGAPPTLLLLDSLGRVGGPAFRSLGNGAWSGRADTLGGLYNAGRRLVDVQSMSSSAEVWIEKLQVGGSGRVTVSDSLLTEVIEQRVSRVVTRGGARGMQLESLPMRSEAVWDVDPTGDLWIAATATYDLHRITMNGDTVRTVKLLVESEPLVGRERDSIAEASAAYSERELPTQKPLIRDLRVGANGWIWVRRRGVVPHMDVWDVFNMCGVLLGSARPPVSLDIKPWLPADAGMIVGVTRDAFDVEYVVRLQLASAAGGELEQFVECAF